MLLSHIIEELLNKEENVKQCHPPILVHNDTIYCDHSVCSVILCAGGSWWVRRYDCSLLCYLDANGNKNIVLADPILHLYPLGCYNHRQVLLPLLQPSLVQTLRWGLHHVQPGLNPLLLFHRHHALSHSRLFLLRGQHKVWESLLRPPDERLARPEYHLDSGLMD